MMMTVQQTAPFSGLLLCGISVIVFPLSQNRQPGFAARVTQWRHQTRHASFLRRSSDTPIFRAVVFTPWLLSDNGGSGGAALGLAGIH